MGTTFDRVLLTHEDVLEHCYPGFTSKFPEPVPIPITAVPEPTPELEVAVEPTPEPEPMKLGAGRPSRENPQKTIPEASARPKKLRRRVQ